LPQEAFVDELALDHCFWREVSSATSPLFRDWLISKTTFAGQSLELLTNETWHQTWFRDPETKKDSETDILLLFRDTSSNKRYALHIENKPLHRTWEPNQPENYRKRATYRMNEGFYAGFQLILLAPSAFLDRYPVQAKLFDLLISYEDVSKHVKEFAIGATIAAPPISD
jgi:hypothetical protein